MMALREKKKNNDDCMTTNGELKGDRILKKGRGCCNDTRKEKETIHRCRGRVTPKNGEEKSWRKFFSDIQVVKS